MKISVIIAAYKGEKYIGEQLASLCRQSRLPDEVLIGDDSGEDLRTVEAVEAFRLQNELPFELKIFRNTPSRGVNGNFRFLAEKASGDLLFFCDQDDVWLPEKIRHVAGVFEREALIDAVCCFSYLTDGDLNLWQVQEDLELANAMKYGNDRKKLFRVFLSHKICGAGHNIALRRHLVGKLPVWRELLFYDLWTLHSTAAAEKLLLLPERLTLHRVHGNNVTISSESYVGGTLGRRLQAIKRSASPHSEFEQLLEERSAFAEELLSSPLAAEIPQKNLQMAQGAVTYLKERIKFRKRSFLLRLLPSFSLVKGYFIWGNGLRSLLRDVAGI